VFKTHGYDRRVNADHELYSVRTWTIGSSWKSLQQGRVYYNSKSENRNPNYED